MERLFTSLFLLFVVGQLANGQENKPAGALLPPPLFIDQHGNPDHRETGIPPTSAPVGRLRLFRRKPDRQPDVYAIPSKSYEAENLPQHPADAVKFDLTPDGRWIILRHNSSGAHPGEPLLRDGLEYPQMRKSFSIFGQ